jgi:hypothetical protein
MDQLGQVIAEMTRLRSLDLGSTGNYKAFDLDSILRGLTGLSTLRCKGKFAADMDLEACGSLPGLRVLELSDTEEVTPACWLALQAMSSLTELVLRSTGIYKEDLTPEVRAAFDLERVHRGWPCLRLEVSF